MKVYVKPTFKRLRIARKTTFRSFLKKQPPLVAMKFVVREYLFKKRNG